MVFGGSRGLKVRFGRSTSTRAVTGLRAARATTASGCAASKVSVGTTGTVFFLAAVDGSGEAGSGDVGSRSSRHAARRDGLGLGGMGGTVGVGLAPTGVLALHAEIMLVTCERCATAATEGRGLARGEAGGGMSDCAALEATIWRMRGRSWGGKASDSGTGRSGLGDGFAASRRSRRARLRLASWLGESVSPSMLGGRVENVRTGGCSRIGLVFWVVGVRAGGRRMGGVE